MSEPSFTFFDFQGKRITSVETPEGFVHICDKQVFPHVSDAVRYIKGEAPNPVIAAMEAEKVVAPVDEFIAANQPVEVKE